MKYFSFVLLCGSITYFGSFFIRRLYVTDISFGIYARLWFWQLQILAKHASYIRFYLISTSTRIGYNLVFVESREISARCIIRIAYRVDLFAFSGHLLNDIEYWMTHLYNTLTRWYFFVCFFCSLIEYYIEHLVSYQRCKNNYNIFSDNIEY